MTTPVASIEGGRTPELVIDDDQGFVEEREGVEISDQGGQRLIRILEQHVWFELSLIVGIPTGSVDKIEVVRDRGRLRGWRDTREGEHEQSETFHGSQGR